MTKGVPISYFLLGIVIGVIVTVAAAYFLLSPGLTQRQVSSTSTTVGSTVSSTSTRSTSSTIASTSTSLSTTSTTSTTTMAPVLTMPDPTPNSQIVRLGVNTTVVDAGASGGALPYQYQWLGAVKNTSSNFTASYGNTFCTSTAQAATCNFQTVVGSNNLIKGVYYLKLRVVDNTVPVPQSVNTSVVSVDVV